MGHKTVCDACGAEHTRDESPLVSGFGGIARAFGGAIGMGGGLSEDREEFGQLSFSVGPIQVSKDLCPGCVQKTVEFLGIKLPTVSRDRRRRTGVVGALTPEEMKRLGLHHILPLDNGFACTCGETFIVPPNATDDDALKVAALAERHSHTANAANAEGMKS